MPRVYRGLTENATKAKKLWREPRIELPSRELHTTHYSMKLEKHKIVLGKNGKPKGLIARHGKETAERFVFFPLEEHIGLFDEANEHIKENGPARHIRGAVGSIGLHRSAVGKTPCLVIRFMQSHFRQGAPKELTRSIATKYGGWRNRLLHEVFNEAETHRIAVSLKPAGKLPEEKRSEEARKKAFIEVAKSRGYKIVKRQGHLIAVKRK